MRDIEYLRKHNQGSRTALKAGSRSKSVENALQDAIRLKKIKDFMALKGNIDLDEESIKVLREAELTENEDHS